ncbi:MAG TPA: alkaline phosphatase family protein [Streptosporangiaceae bacterium]|nr:alkaline phosphatase family protein [Streptosporangiaceae bacterium]
MASRRFLRVAAACGAGVLSVAGFIAPAAVLAAPSAQASEAVIASSGLHPGAIKHVWLIILENKSYDATFSGLNQNTYLWKTLPAQGVLLKNYYGTGHFSMDNYVSLVSGQAPEQDTQEDCSVSNKLIGPSSDILHAGSLATNKNYGQMNSPANASQPSGANAPNGANGCSYPTDVPTLFNQFNAAKVSWKGYAQDIGGAQTPGSTTFRATVTDREAAACAGPGTAANNPDTNPTNMAGDFPAGVTTFTAAQPNDQFVAKHFPFGWFESLTGAVQSDNSVAPPLNEPSNGGANCDGNHIANLDNPSTGLVHDLKSAATTPAFSWITPDNCSDAHDAVCHGNNLSGAFNANGTPDYNSPIPDDPESTTPKNFTGGLYASDLFLEYYIPLIEKSPAFKQGGLIDITFDEGFPAFTYTGNSFNNANAFPATSADKPNFTASIKSDTAGENLFGRNLHFEPTGPNSTLGTDAKGNQLYPGPGDNAFVDRPPVCTQTSPALVPADCVPGIVEGGAGSPPAARTDTVSGGSGSSTITDNSILADDTGRAVTGTNIPADSFVGAVTDTGPQFPTSNTGSATVGSFQLVSQDGTPVDPAGPVSSITLSAEGDPNELAKGQTPDPLFNATLPTTGGGDTGSVLISPFIKPGTVSTVFYNHYSWLRTMEDLFNVKAGHDRTPLPAGTVSGGLDGQGHLGYAAQPGLRPFGRDVFDNPGGFGLASLDSYTTPKGIAPGTPWARTSLAAGAPLLALTGAGGSLMYLRRRRTPGQA